MMTFHPVAVHRVTSPMAHISGSKLESSKSAMAFAVFFISSIASSKDADSQTIADALVVRTVREVQASAKATKGVCGRFHPLSSLDVRNNSVTRMKRA